VIIGTTRSRQVHIRCLTITPVRAKCCAAALSFVLLACGSDDDASDRNSGRCSDETVEALRRWGDAGFSGTITTTAADEVNCALGFGDADREQSARNTVDTVFSIGSVSKAVTAAAVLVLVDDGQLSLAARAGDVLPTLGGPAAEATVEQLMFHTSGLTGALGGDHQPLTREGAIAAAGRLELAFEPGSDYLYSNAGYTLLALIVEQASDTPYREYLVSRVLRLPDGSTAGGFWDGEPAAPGPRAVGYLDDGRTTQMGGFEGPHWALAGNGDVAMTTTQLARWTHALFTGGILSPDSTERIALPGFDHGDGSAEASGWVAFDSRLFGTPVLATAGGGGDVGHDVVVVWVPEGERVLAFASNTSDLTAEELIRQVGPALVEGGSLPLPDDGVTVEPGRLASVAGTYALEPGDTFTVSVEGDELVVSAAGPDAITALFPLPDDVAEDDVALHERHVAELLAGETQEGRDELELLAGDFGVIDDVDVVATIFDEGELRTFVTVASGTETMLMWYALDEEGGIAAAEGPAPAPSRSMVGATDGTFRPDDPAGSRPELSVRFDADRMTITSPGGGTGTVATRDA
jgi:CubicO group peptidase (beta-lactamase class C family)